MYLDGKFYFSNYETDRKKTYQILDERHKKYFFFLKKPFYLNYLIKTNKNKIDKYFKNYF